MAPATVATPSHTSDSDGRFFALSLDLLTVVGFDGLIKRLNPAWERELGWTPEEMIGRPYADFLHPDDRERSMAEAARLAEPGTQTRDFELRVGTTDGRWRWLLISARGVLEEQTIYAVAKDITERRRRQTHLEAQHAVERVLVESPPVASATARILEALGATMDWSAGTYWELDPDDDRLHHRVSWSAGRSPPSAAGASLARGDGPPGRALATGEAQWEDRTVAFPVVSGGGHVLAVLEFETGEAQEADEELERVLRAISTLVGQYLRRKQAEEALAAAVAELRHRADELERSNAELEQFAYVASHDLTEPLRMISGFVSLLAERYRGRLDSDADEFIGYTLDGVERMQALIDGLLAYSRVGRSTHDEPVDLAGVVDDALASLRTAVSERDARVEVGELPTVVGDRRALTQLFQNLLSNAIKFVADGPPSVEVGARRSGDRWEISVRDNGIGVPPRESGRIFDMFQRLHGTEQYPGTGIGLAVCMKIVRRHGGEIRVEPAPGGGSVFVLDLPVAG